MNASREENTMITSGDTMTTSGDKLHSYDEVDAAATLCCMRGRDHGADYGVASDVTLLHSDLKAGDSKRTADSSKDMSDDDKAQGKARPQGTDSATPAEDTSQGAEPPDFAMSDVEKDVELAGVPRRISVRPHDEDGNWFLVDTFLCKNEEDPPYVYIVPRDYIFQSNQRNDRDGWKWGFIILNAIRAVRTKEKGRFRPKERVAIKVVPITEIKKHLWHEKRLRYEPNHPIHENPFKEIYFLRKLESDNGTNVLPLLDAMQDTPEHHETLLGAFAGTEAYEDIASIKDDAWLYIVTPYCPDGSLEDMLKRIYDWRREKGEPVVDEFGCGIGLPPADCYSLWLQMLRLLRFLEDNGICHHDVSTVNLLFHKGHLVLSDFGKAIKTPTDSQGRTLKIHKDYREGGANGFLPPYEDQSFDGFQLDLWGMASSLFRCFSGYQEWHPGPELLLRCVMIHPRIPVPTKVLLSKLLHNNSSKRWTRDQAERHNQAWC